MSDAMTTTASSRTSYLGDLAYFLFRPVATIKMLAGRSLSGAFRERLMLAVTEVNGCGMCSYIHSREALRAGVSRDEIKHILNGLHDDVPADQLPAVLYAQHWAETQGQVDPQAETTVRSAYSPAEFKEILHTLHFINFWNKTVLSLETLVHVLSFGYVGGKKGRLRERG